MNSDGSALAGTGPQPVCRIGEFVGLIAGSWSESSERAFGRETTRQLDLLVGERVFTAFLLKSSPDDLAERGGFQIAGLPEFFALLGLSPSERSKLISTVFRLVAQTFNLRKDPVLRHEFQALLSIDGTPKGKMIIHVIDQIDTAICETSPRLRLGQGSLAISFADQVAIGEVNAAESAIGGRGGVKLAVVDFASPPSAGKVLLISPNGVAVAEMDIRRSHDLRAFSESHARNLPEALNLLAIWDDSARIALSALGRSEPIAATVSLPAFKFRWEITHAYSMDHGLFVSGWFVDPDRLLKEIWLVDYGLTEHGLLGQWVVAPAKVNVDGEMIAVRQFHAFIARREGYRAPANLTFLVELQNRERHVAYVPACQNDRRTARDGILSSINAAGFALNTLTKAFSPAVEPIQTVLNGEQQVAEILDLGTRSARTISIVVPLYREIKFIRPQLIAFNADPFLRSNCQIVYVVDDPFIAHRVRQILSGAVHVFALDIRLVLLERNGGYALANNFGVDEAEGQTIVLMNSDVVPEAPGWLAVMAERLSTLPPSSVIGPKLIYADESLQHAGMYFHSLPNGYWQNMHFFKGYGRNFPLANLESEVPAVTGALMMLRREDYLAVGGFTTDFIIGDYEDSDLCLKLRSRGGHCLYMPSVTLIHFERQSMPGADLDRDTGSTIYNRALHSLRWSETIEGLTDRAYEPRHAG